MSPPAIEALLSEIRPHLPTWQVIKAADQLYYKDKLLYSTDILPEYYSPISGVGKKGTDAAQNAAGNEGKKKKGKADKGKADQQSKTGGVLSPLQAVIEEAKKTVSEALNSTVSVLTSSGPSPSDVPDVRSEVADLRNRVDRLTSEMQRVRVCLQKLLRASGLSDEELQHGTESNA